MASKLNRIEKDRIAPVMDAQRFPGKVQFQVDTGDPLNVEGDLGAVPPVGIAAAILAVAQRLQRRV